MTKIHFFEYNIDEWVTKKIMYFKTQKHVQEEGGQLPRCSRFIAIFGVMFSSFIEVLFANFRHLKQKIKDFIENERICAENQGHFPSFL